MRLRNLIYLTIVAAVVLAVAFNWHSKPALKKTTVPPRTAATKTATSSASTPSYPTDKADSLWVVVNKGRSLPADYVPANLVVPDIPLAQSSTSEQMHMRADAADALKTMAAAAAHDGAHLMLASGYRSYSLQVDTYNSEVEAYGQAKADSESARPGHSEHQTGLAADLEPANRTCAVDDCFADTPEGKWLAANAYKYGFVIRYQEDKETITGYRYEPWHVRYIGTYLSQKLHDANQTLEQYFNLKIYDDYPPQSEQLTA